MMKVISAMACVPIMLIATLLLKPSLISTGLFIVSLVAEFFIVFLVYGYDD